MAEFVALVAEK
jgi:condensin complex subunit 1